MPLLHLQGVGRAYRGGGGTVHALAGVDLAIEAGEMVAIVGSSGSGKSTLMNLLGCLDQPTHGRYRVDGVDVATLTPEGLAALRRERFGFIFQRYHLLAHQDALANVQMPAIYAGVPAATRSARAQALLQRLGLGQRLTHRPNALSGGQQQRVSIARALMNGGEVILADEPTGALDSASGREMLAVLHELHARGHTVIIVTHDAQVAAHAPRVVELQDGRVLRDSGWPADLPRAAFAAPPRPAAGWAQRLRSLGGRVVDAVRMAFDALLGHRLRTGLSLLGISIGIGAVVSIVALSDAARATIDAKLRDFLSGRLMVFRGNPELPPGAKAQPFSVQDLAALRALPGVQRVSPHQEMTVHVRHEARNGDMTGFAAQPGELHQHGLKLVEGRDLTTLDVEQRAQVVVLDKQARDRVFEPGRRAVGSTVLIGPMPFVVVGVAAKGGGALDVSDWRDRVYVPATTYDTKLTGPVEIERLNLTVNSGVAPADVQAAATQVLKVLHGQEDFKFFSLDAEFRKIEEVTGILKLVLAAIAGISLLVGGVGVMNIMLVAVSERTPEIGIRMAVGARPSDVQTQFLVEAVVLCVAGGLMGVAVSWLGAMAVNLVQAEFHVVVSWQALAVAFGVASAIGVGFGFWPARQAAHLSPVQALARE